MIRIRPMAAAVVMFLTGAGPGLFLLAADAPFQAGGDSAAWIAGEDARAEGSRAAGIDQLQPAGYYDMTEPPSEDPLADLQQKFDALAAEWEEHKAELGKKAADAKKKPTFHIGGRIHLDYWGFPHASPGIGFFEHSDPGAADFGEDPEDAFRFRRIRLETRGDLLETMMYRLQVDFAGPAEPEMKDVWSGFRELPGNQELLIGNQKRPL
ncbi:MAG: porin, partial [Maioricimonas sp. JB049]